MQEFKKRLLFRIVSSGFLCAVIYHGIAAWLGKPFPWNTFLFLPEDRFMDFFNNVIAFKEFRFNTIIFPSQNLLFAALSPFKDNIALALFLGVFILYFSGLLIRSFKTRPDQSLSDIFTSLSIGLLSYPFLFVIDRANIESYMFILVSLFALFYAKGFRHLASVPLALAIGAKVFPAVFIIFYLRDRAFKPLLTLTGLLVVLGLTLLIPENPWITLDRTHWFFPMYMNNYVIGDSGLAFGHSIFGILKIGIYGATKFLGRPPNEWYVQHVNSLLKVYSPLTFVCYGLVALLLFLKKEMEYWKQISLLVGLFCLLPHVSGDYKLLHLFTPLIFFFDSKQTSKFDYYYCILFALLLIPKAYFPIFFSASEGPIINPVLMVTLLTLIIREELSGLSLNRKVLK